MGGVAIFAALFCLWWGLECGNEEMGGGVGNEKGLW